LLKKPHKGLRPPNIFRIFNILLSHTEKINTTQTLREYVQKKRKRYGGKEIW